MTDTQFQNRDLLLLEMAELSELQDFLDISFLEDVHAWVYRLQQFDSTELDKLALIRALEVTNGCFQWGFRQQREQAPSLEETREAMNFVMGSIKHQRIVFPNDPEHPIEFEEPSRAFMAEVRGLYLDAFKRHLPGADRLFYASSVGQFLVLGRQRMNAALDRVQDQCHDLFGPYWLEKGRKYCESFLKLADIAAVAR